MISFQFDFASILKIEKYDELTAIASLLFILIRNASEISFQLEILQIVQMFKAKKKTISYNNYIALI